MTTWVVQNLSSYSGNISLAKNNFIDGYTGTYDEIESPVIDISGLANPTLTFYYAHKNFPGRADKLQVLISKDCGEAYNEVFNKQGAELATAGSSTEMFFASDTDFVLETIDLIDYAGGDIIVKFKVTTATGNSIFIDDVKIDIDAVAIENILSDNSTSIIVYPNPASEPFTIEITSTILNEQPIIITIVNTLGEATFNKTSVMKNGKLSEQIHFNQASGVYIIRILAEKTQYEKKIMIE